VSPKSFEVLEPYSFIDGRRLAYVRYIIVKGEARCIGVREVRS